MPQHCHYRGDLTTKLVDFKGGFTGGHIKEGFESFPTAAFLENLRVTFLTCMLVVSVSLSLIKTLSCCLGLGRI